MKRTGNLIEAIADPDNLRLAFFKACRGKRDHPTTLRFRENLSDQLVRLSNELRSGIVRWGNYRMFKIRDPKERMICAAPFRSRVAQHAIMNVCEPYFEMYQIHDSYACRQDKGLDKALARAVGFTSPDNWYLKMDVRKYFDSIDQTVLKCQLRNRFKDQLLLGLFDSIIETYETQTGKGLPIGNLISQHLANFYLAHLDHYVKETLRVGRYVRYMDDFVIWSDSKLALKNCGLQLASYLKANLKLDVKPIELNRCSRGLTFLGYRIFPDRLGLSKRSRARFRRKAIQYSTLFRLGIWDAETYASHIEPLLSFVRRSRSPRFQDRVIMDCGVCLEVRPA